MSPPLSLPHHIPHRLPIELAAQVFSHSKGVAPSKTHLPESHQDKLDLTRNKADAAFFHAPIKLEQSLSGLSQKSLIAPPGTALPAPINKPAKQGVTKTAGQLKEYMAHGANKDIVGAMAWSYGPMLALVPLGPVGAVLGLAPALVASRHGEKRMQQLVRSGRLSETQGPLARLTELKSLWERSELPVEQNRDTSQQLLHKYNQLVDEVLPTQNDANARALRGNLKMTPSSAGYDWLNHAFHAKNVYAQSAAGQFCRPIRQWGKKLPFAPLRVVARIPEYATMVPVVAMNAGKIRALATMPHTTMPEPQFPSQPGISTPQFAENSKINRDSVSV